MKTFRSVNTFGKTNLIFFVASLRNTKCSKISLKKGASFEVAENDISLFWSLKICIIYKIIYSGLHYEKLSVTVMILFLEIYLFCDLWAHSNSAFNFVIYGYTHKGFLRAYKMWLYKICPCFAQAPEEIFSQNSVTQRPLKNQDPKLELKNIPAWVFEYGDISCCVN